MWKEIKKNDTKEIKKFASIANLMNYCNGYAIIPEKIVEFLERKINAEIFMYETPNLDMVIGFKKIDPDNSIKIAFTGNLIKDKNISFEDIAKIRAEFIVNYLKSKKVTKIVGNHKGRLTEEYLIILKLELSKRGAKLYYDKDISFNDKFLQKCRQINCSVLIVLISIIRLNN